MAREVIKPSLLPTTSPSLPSATALSINAIEFTAKMTAAFWARSGRRNIVVGTRLKSTPSRKKLADTTTKRTQ
jgi:hypothetical protein